MKALRWEVYRALLDPAQGSEQGGTRPVMVISHDAINASLPIVAVLPLTSYKAGRRVYPTEVLLPEGTAGLESDSLIMAHQVRTISCTRLQKHYGTLADEELQGKVEKALRVFLDLE
ncbi:MAG: type II toxin-antitoxin system PemK/MazF family toxin [Candidatus Xenobiia bacterium LiM19]